MTDLTHYELMNLLHYDAVTGAFTWKVSRGGKARTGAIAGSLDTRGYRSIEINHKAYKAHRLAWFYQTGNWPVSELDHINRNRDDNRWDNLRLATRSQNMMNAQHHQPSSCGTGITRRNRGYQARISIDGKRLTLGTFKTNTEAVAAYAAAADKLHGNFARTSEGHISTRINRAAAQIGRN